MKTTSFLLACLLSSSIAFANPVMQQDTTQKSNKQMKHKHKSGMGKDSTNHRSDTSGKGTANPTTPPQH